MDIFNQKFDKFKDSVQTSLNHLNLLRPNNTTQFYCDNKDNILKKGWLLLNLDRHEMQLRWCILYKEYLNIYSNMDSLAHPLLSIPLVGTISKLIDDDHQAIYKFNITTAKEYYLFGSKSLETIKEWHAILNKIFYKSIFGQPLDHVLFVDANFERNLCTCSYISDNLQLSVPYIILRLTQNIEQRGLDEEGIFRINGSVKEMKKLCELINEQDDAYVLNNFDIHVVASVFKKFLRDLPEPLIIETLYEKVTTIVNRSMVLDADEALLSLHSCLKLLPLLHFNLLYHLCAFLYHVSLHSNTNKMTIENLSTIFVNTIIQPDDGNDVQLLIATVAPRSAVCAVLITHHKKLFNSNFKQKTEVNEGDLLGLGDVFYIDEHKDKSKSLALELLGFGSTNFNDIIDIYVSNLIDFEDMDKDTQYDNHKNFINELDGGDRRGVILSKNTKNKIIIKNEEALKLPLTTQSVSVENASSEYPILPPKPNLNKQNEQWNNEVQLSEKNLINKTLNNNLNLDSKAQLDKRKSLLNMGSNYMNIENNMNDANGLVEYNKKKIGIAEDITDKNNTNTILRKKNIKIIKSIPNVLNNKVDYDAMLKLNDEFEFFNKEYIDIMPRDQLTDLTLKLLDELKRKNDIIKDLIHN